MQIERQVTANPQTKSWAASLPIGC